MGNQFCCFDCQDALPTYTRIKYDTVKSSINSLDLILFKTPGAFLSKIIDAIERKYIKDTYEEFDANMIESNIFSHSALVVKADILPECVIKGKKYRLDPTKIYVWEAIISGKFGDGVKDIAGNAYIGTQIRCFDELIDNYFVEGKTEMAVCKLTNPVKITAMVQQQFSTIFHQINGATFDYNLISAFASVFESFREFRDAVEKFTGTDDWLFCSEMNALVLKKMGIISQKIDQRDIIPIDYVPIFNKSEIFGITCALIYLCK